MQRSPIDYFLTPFHRFIQKEHTSGVVLLISVVIALLWANSPWSGSYFHLWETRLSVGFAGQFFDEPLHVWINDGLMALFFFVIGLELKREFMVGELSSLRKASLPMLAALGGMFVPALIYSLINFGGPGAAGWGIPMATDIAFALALLSAAGKNVPTSVKVFLSALAVADDLGAVLVIAFFYTGSILWLPLLIGFAGLGLLMVCNTIGVRSPWVYLLLGIVVWTGFLFSGVHATIAGVLVAFTIPARTKINEREFNRELNALSDQFEREIPLKGTLITAAQHQIIEEVKVLCAAAETPLQKIEHRLHPWVAFVIMPVFALANSGMELGGDFFGLLINPVSLGIIAGLVLGKFAGIQLFTWLAVKLRIADMPAGANWKHLRGVAMLAGVGYTMSLFVTSLAFTNATSIKEAKCGILLASVLAGTLGILLLRSSRPPEPDKASV